MEVPRLSGGETVAVQASENSAVSETDPTSALASSNVAYVAGQVDMSQQLFDRARPGFDVVVARDLGAALGASVDSQLVSGSNSSGQTMGLANVTGRVAIRYTDASPTAAELLSRIWDSFRQLSDPSIGYGVSDPDAYVTIMHPRRYAFLQAAFTTPVDELVPGVIVQSAGIRTNLGAGTNEDEAFLLVRDESFLCIDPPKFRVFPELGSAALTVRVQAVQFLAAMFARQPRSIAHLTGTGFTPPVL